MRPSKLSGKKTESVVSIHASVKDATETREKVEMMFSVSIHASVKDATVWRGYDRQ